MKRTMKNIKIGDVFFTNQGCSVTVISVMSYREITVTFNDAFRHTTTTRLQHLNAGSLKNPYHPNVINMGYIGVGPYVASVNGINTVVYDAWRNMLKRCYCPSYQQTQPSYIGCSVESTWLNFQIFAHWYCNHPNYGKGYHLDKDILVEGNRIYSAQYCSLVPEAINILFGLYGKNALNKKEYRGVYKHYGKYQAECNGNFIGTFSTIEEASSAYIYYKRGHILSLIEKYKSELSEGVYYAMYALAYSI